VAACQRHAQQSEMGDIVRARSGAIEVGEGEARQPGEVAKRRDIRIRYDRSVNGEEVALPRVIANDDVIGPLKRP
jgi:hypothetical protein